MMFLCRFLILDAQNCWILIIIVIKLRRFCEQQKQKSIMRTDAILID